MKMIPESFELNEDDIKKAISYWLVMMEITHGEKAKFAIKLHANSLSTPTTFTAVAVKEKQ